MEEHLRRVVGLLARPDGRVPGSVGHARARSVITEALGRAGVEPYEGPEYELPYASNGLNGINIAGILPGSKPYLPAIFLDAHYDTCGAQPGADDNAAAVAILLALIEPINAMGLEHTVVFLFPDAEEPPYFLTDSMGSTVFFREQSRHESHCSVVLDLVGHDVPLPGLDDLLFMTGIESDPRMADILECMPAHSRLRVAPTLTRYIGDLGDYYIHRLEKRPYLFLSCGHWPHYHAATDTPERLNYSKMAAIVDFLVQMLALLDRTPLDGPFEGYDSTDLELHLLDRALGETLGALGLSLQSRSDIDRLAVLLTQHFGL